MTSPTTPTKKSNSAFTLVEMLLVVIIIGILVSVTVPHYAGSFEYMKLRSGAYDVATTLEYAQSTSILEERTLRFNVSDDGASCWISEESLAPDARPLEPVSCDLPDGVKIARLDFTDAYSSARYVDFRPSGECASCVLTVENRVGEQYEIRVLPGLGYARVRRVEKRI